MKKNDDYISPKKRDKKKFIRSKVNLSNVSLKSFNEDIIDIDNRFKPAEKNKAERALQSPKLNMKLTRGRIVEIRTNYIYIVKINDYNYECILSGRLKNVNFESKNPLAVGDYVNVNLVEENRSNENNNLIEEICPRENVLVRFADSQFQEEKIIAANIDQVIITASVVEPEIRWGLIDRYLISCAIMDIKPIICLNKIDLVKDLNNYVDYVVYYESCDIEVVFTSVKSGEGLDILKKKLKSKDTIFSGYSGVGKSSLINALNPEVRLKVGEVSQFSSKGTHTTSSSKLIPWSFGGNLVDTPGIKQFGLSREYKNDIPRLFPGFDHFSLFCRFNNCTHIHEDECEIKEKVSQGVLKKDIYESYLRIYKSL